MNSTTTTDQSEIIVCPNSDEHCHPLASGYVLHHASRAELAAHGGVCRECFEKFQKGNQKCLHGKVETPAEFLPEQVSSLYHDHVGGEEGHRVAVEDFNFAALDGDGEVTPDAREQAAVLIARLFVWVWSKPSLQSALVKFSALSAGLRSDLCRHNYSEIAEELGVTKSAVSKAAVNAENAFGITFTRSRSKAARDNMAAAQRGHAPTNRRKAAA